MHLVKTPSLTQRHRCLYYIYNVVPFKGHVHNHVDLPPRCVSNVRPPPAMRVFLNELLFKVKMHVHSARSLCYADNEFSESLRQVLSVYYIADILKRDEFIFKNLEDIRHFYCTRVTTF